MSAKKKRNGDHDAGAWCCCCCFVRGEIKFDFDWIHFFSFFLFLWLRHLKYVYICNEASAANGPKRNPRRSPPLYQIFFLSSVLATAAGHHFLLYFSYIHKIPFSRDMAVGHARCWWQHFAPRFLSNPSHWFPFFFLENDYYYICRVFMIYTHSPL